MRRWPHRIILVVAGFALVVVLAGEFLVLAQMPNSPGRNWDFIGKWASAKLLLQGRDPWDKEELLVVETEGGLPRGWEPATPRQPPTLQVLFIPLALLAFERAAAAWFVLNICILILSALGLADTLFPRGEFLGYGLALLAVLTFSKALHALLIGQVNTLVLAGLVGCLCFLKRDRGYSAGTILVLTTVKPHLVYIALPVLLMEAGWRKQWRVIVGFLAACLGLLAVATLLYPSWPISYLSLMFREATRAEFPQQLAILRGAITASLHIDLGKYLWIPTLAVFLVLYLRYRERLSLTSWVSLALLAGLPTAPFGWSHDQVVFLVIIMQLVAWTVESNQIDKKVVIPSLLLIYGYSLWFWLGNYQELPFLALPLALGFLYWYGYRHKGQLSEKQTWI